MLPLLLLSSLLMKAETLNWKLLWITHVLTLLSLKQEVTTEPVEFPVYR
mgnify:CR=1 FL=1